MDRRQRKTREAVFSAFSELLSEKNVSHITVGEIIERADIGRATFYSHFETKEFLLKELCEELFCHIFDSVGGGVNGHRHIFDCDAPDSVFLHLLQHIKKNDNNILRLLSCQNNETFLRYFKDGLIKLTENYCFIDKEEPCIPRDLQLKYISSTFVEVVKWWIDNRMKQSPEEIACYFYSLTGYGK